MKSWDRVGPVEGLDLVMMLTISATSLLKFIFLPKPRPNGAYREKQCRVFESQLTP